MKPVHPTLAKYRGLVSSFPAKCQEYIYRAQLEQCSLVTGRNFGEDFGDYLARRPDIKDWYAALSEAIAEMMSFDER